MTAVSISVNDIISEHPCYGKIYINVISNKILKVLCVMYKLRNVLPECIMMLPIVFVCFLVKNMNCMCGGEKLIGLKCYSSYCI